MTLIRRQLVIAMLLCLLAIAWCGLALSPRDPYIMRVSSAKADKDSLVKKYAAAGETLFKENCNTCHSLSKTDNMLTTASVIEREPYDDYLVDFLLNTDSMITHNGYARAVYNAFGSAQPSFKGKLTPAEIKEIEVYIIVGEKRLAGVGNQGKSLSKVVERF